MNLVGFAWILVGLERGIWLDSVRFGRDFVILVNLVGFARIFADFSEFRWICLHFGGFQ